MKTYNAINEEALSQIEIIHKMNPGTDECKVAIDGVTKLMTTAADLEKIELERIKMEREKEEKAESREIEIRKMEIEQKDQKIKNRIAIAGITLPIAAAVWANVYNWVKEENGIMTSTFGKKAMDFLSRFKK